MRTTRMIGTAAVIALMTATACVFGDDAAMQRAKQTCQSRDLAPGSAAYDTCVFEESEKIYISWGRDRPFYGLD